MKISATAQLIICECEVGVASVEIWIICRFCWSLCEFFSHVRYNVCWLYLVTDSFHAKTLIVVNLWRETRVVCGMHIRQWHTLTHVTISLDTCEYWWQSDNMRHDHSITSHQPLISHARLTHCCGQVSGMEPGTRLPLPATG